MAPLEHWQQPSAHREYWETQHNAYVYEYDPTDDGPECNPLRWIPFTHTRWELKQEQADFEYSQWLLDRVAKGLREPREHSKTYLDVARGSVFADRLRLRGVEL